MGSDASNHHGRCRSRPTTLMMPPTERAPQAPELGALYRSYGPTVRQALRRLGVAESHLDDAVQDVFVVLVRRIAAFDRRRSMTNWLWGIARGVASTHRRSIRRRERLHASVPSCGSTSGLEADDAISLAEARAILESFLRGLDEDKCAVFVMSEVEGRTGPEIARHLDVNLNTVYARLRAAKQRWARTVERSRPSWIRGWWAAAWPTASGASSTAWIPAAAGTTLAAALVIPTAVSPQLDFPELARSSASVADATVAGPSVTPRPELRASRAEPEPAKEEDEPIIIEAQEMDTMRIPAAATLALAVTAAAPASAKPPARGSQPAHHVEPDDQDADAAALKRVEGDTKYLEFENDAVDGERLAPDGSLLLQRPQNRFPSLINIRSHFNRELMWLSTDL